MLFAVIFIWKCWRRSAAGAPAVEDLGEVSSNDRQYSPTAERLGQFFTSWLKRMQTTSFKSLGKFEKMTKKYISVVLKAFKDVNMKVIIVLSKINSTITSY